MNPQQQPIQQFPYKPEVPPAAPSMPQQIMPAAAPPSQPQTVLPGQPATNQALASSHTVIQPTGQPLAPQMQPAQPMQPQPMMAQPMMQQALPQQAIPQHPNPDLPIATQTTLQISELRDSLVIMKDGSFRAVIACQSINFDLMSEAEREGVEYSYQNFINSLESTTQILIRSQRVDITPYLDRLSQIRRNNDNMLLGVLMDDYINFIDALSQEANIMDKSFFIVIPYYTSKDAEKAVQQTKNFFQTFTRGSKTTAVTRIDRATYEKAIQDINNRVDSVVSGLFQIGINSVRLNTKELAELYYNFNNPDTAIREPLVDFSKIATTYVRKGQKNA